jgi:uncharacterized caspase-like protein
MREILEKRCGFQFGPGAAFFLKDQDGESMKKAMRRFIHFCSKIARPCTTFFYFSGHGHMRDGKNFLAPVDYSAEKAAEAYLKDAVATVTFDIDVDVIGPLNSAELRDPRNINIIMLDCCRSDDLNATYRGGASACSDLRVQWGQSEISSHRGDNDDCVKDSSQFYIAHATRPGTSANEFTFDQYGVFTLKFLEAVRSDQGETRTSLSDMFIATTDAVRFWSLGKLKAGRTQIPQISISATEKVYLVTTPGASLEHKNADIDIGDMFTHAPADGESNLDVGANGNEDSLSFLDCPEFNDDFLDPEQKGSMKPKLFRCMQAWPRVPFSAHAAERSFHRNLPGLAEFFANQPTLKVLGVRDFPYKNGERLELEREFWILDPNIVEGMEMRLVVIHVHTTSLWQHESLKPVKERNWDRITQINIRHTSDRPMFPHHPQIGVAQGLCYQGRIFDEPRWPEGGRGVALLQRSTAEGWNWQKNKHDVNMDPNNQLCTAAASFQTKVGMDWKVAVRGSIVLLLLKVKDKVTSKGRLFRMLGGAREIGDAQSIVTSPTSEQRLGPSKRLALVIANAKYTEAGAALAKTTADGEDMRDALRQHGYEVTFVLDATKVEMTKQIRAFVSEVEAARPCDSFFFFAGHGKEANGENYLLPIEYRAPDASNQEREEDMAIDLNANLLKELNGNGVGHQHTLNIVMLDCCREDPTNDTFRSRGGFGGAGSLRGLCMNTRGATSRTGSSQFLIAFGSAPGTVCIEYKEDRNGAFTGAFLRVLKQKSHLPVETFWKQVTNEVQIRTKRKQKPWVSSGGFTKDFSFALDCAKHGGSTPARQGGSSSSGSISGGSSGGSGSASGGSCGGGGGSSSGQTTNMASCNMHFDSSVPYVEGSSKRLALVIANSDYLKGDKLPMAKNDGEDMRRILEKHGFSVDFVRNAQSEFMRQRIRQFVTRVAREKPCVSFFFFAGHGKEANGKHYWLPIQEAVTTQTDADDSWSNADWKKAWHCDPSSGKYLEYFYNVKTRVSRWWDPKTNKWVNNAKEQMQQALQDAENRYRLVELNKHLLAELNGPTARNPDTLNIVVIDCCRADHDNATFRNIGDDAAPEAQKNGGGCDATEETLVCTDANQEEPQSKAVVMFQSKAGADECAHCGQCRDIHVAKEALRKAIGVALQPALSTRDVSAAGSSQFFIAFGSAPGTKAHEGFAGERNGQFTGALLNALERNPSMQLEALFKETRTEVTRRTSGKQLPWTNASISSHFSFQQQKAGATAVATGQAAGDGSKQ